MYVRRTVHPMNCPKHGDGISRVPIRTVDEAFLGTNPDAPGLCLFFFSVGNDVAPLLSPLFGLFTEDRPADRLACQPAVSLRNVLERPWSAASLSTQRRLCPQLAALSCKRLSVATRLIRSATLRCLSLCGCVCVCCPHYSGGTAAIQRN